MFQRYYDAGLAQASYLLGCARTRQAVVIDPRRDIDVYVAAARQHHLTITAAIETHIHADFLSGAPEFAALDAQVLAGPGSSLRYRAREVRHDERMTVGDLSLRFLHTPGHTPEHISVVARYPAEPERVFTGDTLFVSAVGRPDLLGASLTRALAEDLHASLFDVLLALDDSVEVHPGHGAGSLCGTRIGADAHSTIGRERRTNPMLKYASREEFVDAVLADLPETPSYFARMKRQNQRGAPLLHLSAGVDAVRALDAPAALAAVRNGTVLIDLRPADLFGAQHVAGAINLAFGPSVGHWAAWLLPPESRIVLLGAAAQEATQVRRQLLRVGLDSIAGTIDGGVDAWRATGLPLAAIPQIAAHELHQRLVSGERITIVDVRTREEWQRGHIDGSRHVPVSDIPARAHELPGDGLLVTICEGGYRSSLAASLLAREGLTSVGNAVGGMAAYRTAAT